MHLCTFSSAFNNTLKTFRTDRTSLNDFLEARPNILVGNVNVAFTWKATWNF